MVVGIECGPFDSHACTPQTKPHLPPIPPPHHPPQLLAAEAKADALEETGAQAANRAQALEGEVGVLV